MKFNSLFAYTFLIFIGIIMALITLTKLLGFYNFSSDWFWFIGAIGLIIESTIALIKQRKFDQKYKIVLKTKND